MDDFRKKDIKIENTPLSIERARNYLNHKDFHKNTRGKIEKLKDAPLTPTSANPHQQLRALRTALACLPNTEDGMLCRKLLSCKIRGASDEQLSMAMKISVIKVQQLERRAMALVKDTLRSRAITPVVT